MRNDVIHRVFIDFEIFSGMNDFFIGRLLLLPPVFGGTEFKILTVSAAKCKKAFSAYRIDFSAHQMNQIRCDYTRSSAVPFLRRVFFQHIIIFVAAVHECYRIFQLRQLFAEFLLLLGVVPEKAEITADNHDIIRVCLF